MNVKNSISYKHASNKSNVTISRDHKKDIYKLVKTIRKNGVVLPSPCFTSL